MNRPDMLRRVHEHPGRWDILVVGGGATGIGIAIDAASRGYDALLLEQSDFGKGASSRSTKLVHGGVRYLEQGNISLVMEALKERGLLLRNAPHLVRDLAFVVPNYEWWEAPFYGIGLKVYDLLAGRYGFGPSRLLSKEQTLERLPTIKTEGLRGGVVYYDGQFDDARLLIHMAATAAEQGATLLNYAPVTGITKDAQGFASGVLARDEESGEEFEARAKVVVNATGAWTDFLRCEADPAATPMIAPSQGIHLVFPRSFLPGDSAIMVPHTSDGRVMFAIPWHGHVIVGTTDTPLADAPLEPRALDHEIEFILSTASLYLANEPTRDDVLSVFAGIRPLVKSGESGNTSTISRDHTIHIDKSGLLSICGGKWTTYRRMAEDCVNHASTLAQLPERPCMTKELNIHGHHTDSGQFGHLWVHGSDAPAVQALMRRGQMHPDLPYTEAEVIWAARFEMARTVEDVLARRTRALFLNAKAALAMAPKVAEILAAELGHDSAWKMQQIQAFEETARNYVLS
jgi:glycerol-3-phosphate dehydrogenase